MPQFAARLFLRVKSVRVERLNQITNEGILREGIRSEACNICVHTGGSGCEHCFALLKPFRDLWDSLNGRRYLIHEWEDASGVIRRDKVKGGYSWDSNPWVWVIEFERKEADHG